MNTFIAELTLRFASIIRKDTTFKQLDFFRSSRNWTIDELNNYQNNCLKELVPYLQNYVPFYEKVTDFQSCPVITRSIITKQPSLFMSTQNIKIAMVKKTSGSTGEPVKVCKDRYAISTELSMAMRCYEWAGVPPGLLQARFWGSPFSFKPKLTHFIRDFLLNRKRFSSFSFSDEIFYSFYQSLKKFPTFFIYGYTSIIYQFSLYLLNAGLKIPNIKAIITTAEPLTESMRGTMESVFNVKVFNEYGCSEVGIIAMEDEDGRMVVNADNLLVEVLQKDGTIKSEGTGEILVTELHNRVQPLIRYALGDIVEVIPPPINSRMCFPVIKSIQGRIRDTIVGKNDKEYHGALVTYIFNQAITGPGQILEYQLTQTNKQLEIKIVRGVNYSINNEKKLQELFKNKFDNFFNCQIAYCELKDITREKNGKKKLIIRNN